MELIVKTEGLCKQYGGIYRVKDLDLSVPQACVYGFLGPNGAGKSTTLKMLLGLVRKTAGSISLMGMPMEQENRLEILRGVGSLIESPAYYGHLSGYENLQILQKLTEAPQKQIKEVLEIVRLQNQKDKKVSQYSLGMKQRLGIAGALLGHPKLLLLDEPTNGLDPAGIQEMRELIISLPKTYGMTVVVSSHLLSEVEQIATQVGIINGGELIFQGSMESLQRQSRPRIVLRTSNDALACELLRGEGIPAGCEDGVLSLADAGDEMAARSNAVLVSAGLSVWRIEETRKSLEDIFLELTGKAVSL